MKKIVHIMQEFPAPCWKPRAEIYNNNNNGQQYKTRLMQSESHVRNLSFAIGIGRKKFFIHSITSPWIKKKKKLRERETTTTRLTCTMMKGKQARRQIPFSTSWTWSLSAISLLLLLFTSWENICKWYLTVKSIFEKKKFIVDLGHSIDWIISNVYNILMVF